MEEIHELNQEIQELIEQIERKRQEAIKSKLKYLQNNPDNPEAHLTEEEKEILTNFLKERGDSKSVVVQQEWRYAAYPEDSGYDYFIDKCYLRLGDKIYSIRDNKFIDKSEIEEDFKTIYDDSDMSIMDDEGRETLIGDKDGLTQPLDIEKLFDMEIQINSARVSQANIEEDDEYEYEDDDIQPLDDTQQKNNPRQQFEESLLRDDIVEYYLSKTPEELETELGPEVARMVGFEQKNSHHCYDLWEHTLRTVEGIKPDGLTEQQYKKLRVAAFFHDIGKPDVAKFNEKTGQQVFYGHAMHSIDVASPILERLGYSEDEIEQLSFYIGHHDDFISYKSETAPWMKTHEFIRGIDSDTVSEKIIENQYDFKAMGYDADQIRYICYALGHDGQEPTFTTQNGPIDIKVNMAEVQEKIDSGDYASKYIPSEEDYNLLLQLCKADAGAQSEVAMQQGKVVGSKKEKLENMNNIENSMPEAFKSVAEKVKGYTFEQFIKDSVPQAFGEKRPMIICKDGTEYSIQASSFHACSPRQDGLESYEEFEIGNVKDWVTGDLEQYTNDDEIAEYVPKEVIEDIIKAHGGLDKKIMRERVEEQKAVYKPKNDEYEKMIQEASGGNEFIANMLRYAMRRVDVREKNDEAKKLTQEYEQQLPKGQQSLNDE